MNADEIQNIFFVECEESLEAAEAGLDACKAGTQDAETINAIFRAVHSIKGGAGAFGYSALQTFTHCFETLLADVRENKVEISGDLVNNLLNALDCLRDHVDAAQTGSDAPDDAAILEYLTKAHEAANAGPEDKPKASESTESDDDDIDALLDDLLGDAGPEADAPSQSDNSEAIAANNWFVTLRPKAGAMDNGCEPLLWLRELNVLGGECQDCDIASVPALEEFDPASGYLGWTFRMPGSVSQDQVQEIFEFAEDDCILQFSEDGCEPASSSEEAATEGPSEEPAQSDQPSTNPAPEAPVPQAKAASKPASSSQPSAKSTQADNAPAAGAAQNVTPVSQSIRIDLGKLDKLIDGVGELVIAQAMLTQRLADHDIAHVEELSMLDSLVRDVQESAMAFRAQPIGSVFSRVPRLLRELATSTGKHVKLEVHGESTELDKTVIERLGEPLTHLIRNAVDHGIEDADERRNNGKDPEGTLTLSAEQKAGRVLIRISDDGRGISAEKVLAKAMANGLITEDAQLSEEEINNLVFAPGFSTAEKVSSVSGRGVGMDVVRQNVKELGGRIMIESKPGVGTSFIMALPLTLAISDGMIVQSGDQSLVVPLAHVVESLRPMPSDIKAMGSEGCMVNVRGRFLPVLSLATLTGGSSELTDPCQGVAVIVETERCGQAALLVDTITDQRQFVIKSLDTHYHAVDGVAGATILGNGRVALIVDVDHLVQAAGQAGKWQAAA